MAKLSDLKALLNAGGRKPSPPKAAPTAGAPDAGLRAANARGTAAGIAGDEKQSEPVEDIDLRALFVDVRPLARSNRAILTKALPQPRPTQRIADEAAALALSKYGDEPSPSSWDIGQELEAAQTFVRAGIGSDVLAKLRRGQWVVQAELDLHRHTTEQAHDALADFLFDARARGWRCVRVIHGKGLSSPKREPVLKGKVRRWLSVWDDVLAYCEAPRHAGGGGAVLVLLKAASA